jgi:hypothetical protein
LFPFLEAVIGPVRYEITNEDLRRAGVLVVPKIEYVRTDFHCSSSEWVDIIEALTEDAARNALALGVIERALDEGRQVLALTEQVSTCGLRFGGCPNGTPAQSGKNAVLRVLPEARAGYEAPVLVGEQAPGVGRKDFTTDFSRTGAEASNDSDPKKIFLRKNNSRAMGGRPLFMLYLHSGERGRLKRIKGRHFLSKILLRSPWAGGLGEK